MAKKKDFVTRPGHLMYYWVKFSNDEQPVKIQGKSWFDIIEELTILAIKHDRIFEWVVREYL